MSESIFTKIIRGELPCYKVYEDARTFAFLDINPLSDGHILVVSKSPVDKVYHLSQADYTALFATVRKLCDQVEAVLGVRAGIIVEGFDIPHAHVHVVPLYDAQVMQLHHGYKVDNSPANLAKLAERLRLDD